MTRCIAPNIAYTIGAVGISLALGGCAVLARSDDYLIPPWRIAEVISVGPAAAWTQAVYRDCSAAPAKMQEAAVFAVIVYRDGPRHARRQRLARVPAIDGLRVGDRVRFNTADCVVPIAIELPSNPS